MTRLAIAAFSARALVELAVREGHEVVALDLFGDRDTRRVASAWFGIGDPTRLQIDAAPLLAALDELRAQGVEGWLVGGGFDGRADLLEAGAARLPLIGNDAATVARVRTPQSFFAALDAAGIAHPAVTFDWPADPQGWLRKDAAGSGGLQVVPAADLAPHALPPGTYLQREAAGVPMSATFVANGREAVVLGCNEQIVQGSPEQPFLYAGVIGPVPVAAAVYAELTRGVQTLVAHFGLRGLGSLDFLLDGGRMAVLELNPRLPASAVLYPRVGAGGPIAAHLDACRGSVLPPAMRGDAGLSGSTIVYARRPLHLGDGPLAWLAAQPDVHDLPGGPWHGRTGDPVCSLTAQGQTPAAVREQLLMRRDELLSILETFA